MGQDQDLEKLIFKKGSLLLEASRKKESLFLKKNWWYQKMLSWTMSHQQLKTNLFHFIDVLPSLSKDELVVSHFKEYFKDQNMARLGLGLGALSPSLLARGIRKQIQQVAKMFITGSDIKEALPLLSKNWKRGLAFSIDILGEATLSEKEALCYFDQYLHLMEELSQAVKNWPKKEKLQKDIFGPIPSVNVSIKASSLYSQIKTEAWEESKKQIKARLRPLFQKAVQDFIFINLDMEQYEYKNLFLESFKELLMEEEFKNYPHFGVVIQSYLKESLEDLQELARFSQQRGEVLTVRLVKGAYWDSELLLAKQKNWFIPVYTNKPETDANFEACLKWIFKKSSHLKLAVGSHNIRSIACALALQEQYPQTPLEFQVLYGMGEGLAQALVEKNYCVRLYSTIGELIPGMSYLVRRLLENSANQSFILNSFLKDKTPEELLKEPKSIVRKKISSLKKEKDTFQNHPLLDFSKKENRIQFQQALHKVQKQFPVEVPLILKGKPVRSDQTFQRENPAQIDQIVSCSFLAQKDQAEQALDYTSSFFPEWKAGSPQKRISCLRKLASLLQKKEFELSSLQVFEVGKTWREAQADVSEAIDFCNYYAESYEKLIRLQKTDRVAGEDSFLHYEAIGPTAVIAPWNFPLAILTGMTVAPLVCGNTVLIKPAEQSALSAFRLAELLLESGFPEKSFAFLPGKGEEIGEYLVSHPKISILSFTGSFEVGSKIISRASQISPQQKDIKKCIVEMGGKNAIVLDSSADLDEAISGILTSAFGFQGQKCSACSRVIVLENIYEAFMERFIPAVQSLVSGSPKQPEVSLGPLIEKSALQRVREFINREKSQKLSAGEFKNTKNSWLCPPIVYLATEADSDLMQKELFAPLLAIFKVKDLEEAIQQTNHTGFGLTAGFYSRHPAHIEKFKSQVEVGNLYINRNCTGALVKRHPFGGRKMSGLGSKTGGMEYLKQFLHTKILTENKMRRGFSPELFE